MTHRLDPGITRARSVPPVRLKHHRDAAEFVAIWPTGAQSDILIQVTIRFPPDRHSVAPIRFFQTYGHVAEADATRIPYWLSLVGTRLFPHIRWASADRITSCVTIPAFPAVPCVLVLQRPGTFFQRVFVT